MEPIFKESAAVKKAKEREIAISAAAEVFGALVGSAIPTAEQLIIPESLPPTANKNITFYDDNFNTNIVKTQRRTGNVNADADADASAARMLSFGGARRKHKRGSRKQNRRSQKSRRATRRG
jgi:hypothetical protein